MHISQENKHAIKFQVPQRDGVYGTHEEPCNFSVIDMCGITTKVYWCTCAKIVNSLITAAVRRYYERIYTVF